MTNATIETDIRRMLAYGWPSVMIVHIIERMHGVKIAQMAIERLKKPPAHG